MSGKKGLRLASELGPIREFDDAHGARCLFMVGEREHAAVK